MDSIDHRAQLNELQATHHHAEYARLVDENDPLHWLDACNADAWGNRLCLEQIAPFLSQLATSSFVTIGDGRWGREARFIRNFGHHACATDLCAGALTEAHRHGYIDTFSEENAEQLSFADEAFDFAFTKESLHHMPRPYLAVYEMLRVARQGIILIEPHQHRPAGVLSSARHFVREVFALLGGKSSQAPKITYEPCGNYLYRFSSHELIQCALGLGLPWVAYGYAHHFWKPGFGDITGLELQRLIQRKRREMWLRDAVRGKAARPLLIFMIFKRPIGNVMKSVLQEAGFLLPELPQNPACSGTPRDAVPANAA